MWLFHKIEQYYGYNIYSLKKCVDRKRIIFSIIVATIIFIALLFIIYYMVDTRIRLNRSRQFVSQIIEYKKQQEDIKIQREKDIQSKIPKLTDVGRENLKKIYNEETKKAFLTFDDGPSRNTRPILDILKEQGIQQIEYIKKDII